MTMMHNLNSADLTSRLVAAAMEGNIKKTQQWAVQLSDGKIVRMDPNTVGIVTEQETGKGVMTHEKDLMLKAMDLAKKTGGKAVLVNVWEIVEVED